MIVVDASAAVHALLSNGEARRRLSDEPTAAPHLIDAEVAQALRMSVRRGHLTSESGGRALDRWSRLGIERFGLQGLLDRMWELRDNVTAFDAAYVALAESLDGPLLTADERLARAPGPRAEIVLVDGRQA